MPPEAQTDPQRQLERDLLLRAQAGDGEAFGDLWLLLEPMLRRFVRRLVGWDSVIADEEDDILQVSAWGFYRHLGEISPPERLRAYVFRIVRNRCYDLLRQSGRAAYQTVSLDGEEDAGEWSEETLLVPTFTSTSAESAGGMNPVEDTVHWLLVNLEVRAAIDQLPEAQRQALILYAEEEMTCAEIAEVLGVQIGTVKSRLFYGKQRLRTLLKPETLALFGDVLPNEAADEASRRDERARMQSGQTSAA